MPHQVTLKYDGQVSSSRGRVIDGPCWRSKHWTLEGVDFIHDGAVDELLDMQGEKIVSRVNCGHRRGMKVGPRDK
jgi:hypothetical protein